MNLDELRALAANLFPFAVANAVERPGEENPELLLLKKFCWDNFKPLGFDCMASCFDAIMPRTDGKLNLDGWSSAEMSVLPWTFRVSCRPLFMSSSTAHFEIRHDGPLPGVTETAYRSIFEPMATFANRTPEEFIRINVCKDLPNSAQMRLF